MVLDLYYILPGILFLAVELFSKVTPLDPLGFALALHPVIERIKREILNLLINA